MGRSARTYGLPFELEQVRLKVWVCICGGAIAYFCIAGLYFYLMAVPAKPDIIADILPKALGPFLLVSGILLDLFVVRHFVLTVRRIARWTKTTGTVARLETSGDRQDGYYYTPVVEFIDRTGQRYECRPPWACYDKDEYQPGSSMNVAYDLNDPQQADCSNTCDRYKPHLASFLAVSLTMVLFGYGMTFVDQVADTSPESNKTTESQEENAEPSSRK